MSTTNLFAQFRKLIPTPPLLVCVVISTSNGGAIVELPGGSRLAVRGTGTVGATVFLRNGQIEGPAPNLTAVNIEV